MYKSFAIMALVMGASAVNIKQDFAEGQGADEWNGQTIRIGTLPGGNAKGFESYQAVQTEDHDPKSVKKFHKKWLQEHDHPHSHAANKAAGKKHQHHHGLVQRSNGVKKFEQKWAQEHDHPKSHAANKWAKHHMKHTLHQHKEKFADGLSDKEHNNWGETIRMGVEGNAKGFEVYKYAQKEKKHGFAEGLNDEEHKWGTSIRTTAPGGNSKGFETYNYAQQESDFAVGLNDKEHRWNTKIVATKPGATPKGWEHFTYAQTEADMQLPARGEKQWQAWAQNLVNHEDSLTNTANTRIPYASTLAQLSSAPAKAAAVARPPGPVRGEKQWQDWAQNLVNHEDSLTNTANTRIPYASTLQLKEKSLVQTSDENNDELVKMEDSKNVPLNFRF